MKLEADINVIKFFFKKQRVGEIAQEEISEDYQDMNIFSRIYMQGWMEGEEYHRELKKKGISEKQDAINRNLRLS